MANQVVVLSFVGVWFLFVEGKYCEVAEWAQVIIRSAKQDEIYGASNIILPCPGSWVIFHLVEDVVIISKSSI
jgi:hypothetical protein